MLDEATTIMPEATQRWLALTIEGHHHSLLTIFWQLKTFNVPIIGGRDCAHVSQVPKNGDTFTIGENIKVKALHTPCHTQDSVCFFMEDGNDRAVFTGDTLFIGGKPAPSTAC